MTAVGDTNEEVIAKLGKEWIAPPAAPIIAHAQNILYGVEIEKDPVVASQDVGDKPEASAGVLPWSIYGFTIRHSAV